jgi:hypothetical protein
MFFATLFCPALGKPWPGPWFSKAGSTGAFEPSRAEHYSIAHNRPYADGTAHSPKTVVHAGTWEGGSSSWSSEICSKSCDIYFASRAKEAATRTRKRIIARISEIRSCSETPALSRCLRPPRRPLPFRILVAITAESRSYRGPRLDFEPRLCPTVKPEVELSKRHSTTAQ